MSDVNVIKNSENPSDAIAAPLTIKMNGKPYTLSHLTPYDLAQTESYMLAERLNIFLEQTRTLKGVHLPDETRGIAIGAILGKTVGIDDVLNTYKGQVYLLYLSLKKASPALTVEEMSAIGPIELATLTNILAILTGLKVDEEKSSDPLEVAGSTSTPDDSNPISPTGGSTFQG